MTTFVSDRRATIAKVDEGRMYKTAQTNEKKPNKIEHYYDCWHIARSKNLLVLM